MLLAFLVGTSEGILLILVRNLLGLAYSKDQEVVAYVAKMMFILAPSVLFDGLQYVLSGKYCMQRPCIYDKYIYSWKVHVDSLNSFVFG
jgi:hypothetical protein